MALFRSDNNYFLWNIWEWRVYNAPLAIAGDTYYMFNCTLPNQITFNCELPYDILLESTLPKNLLLNCELPITR